MLKKLSVGSELVYYCSRCGLELGHTILAMVNAQPARVRCNTCKSERNFRTSKKPADILSENRPRPKISRPDLHAQKMKESVMKTPKNYSVQEKFEMGDVVIHPNFGKGVVTKVIFPDRVEVLFADQLRALIHKPT